MRSDNDVHRSIISYVALAEKRGLLRYVTQNESMLVRIHKKNDYERLEKKGPLFFCMNDSEYASDSDRKKSKEMLEKWFPHKSSFER